MLFVNIFLHEFASIPGKIKNKCTVEPLIFSGLSLEGDLGEKVSLNRLFSAFLSREFKCTEQMGKSKTLDDDLPKCR